MTTVTKHREVLNLYAFDGQSPGFASFSHKPNDDSDVPPSYELDRDLWREMGEPETITVTIEPGDLLNV